MDKIACIFALLCISAFAMADDADPKPPVEELGPGGYEPGGY